MKRGSRYARMPLLFMLLFAGCGKDGADSGESPRIDIESEGAGVRPGVILSDTALGASRGTRASEALPGPGDLPSAPAPAAPSGTAGAPVQPPQASAPPAPAPAATPAADGGWMSGIARRGGGNLGVATLTQVRSARNDGFDRIVFQFAGPTVPGYTISYIDEPVRQCGSGNVVPMPGDAWLSMRMEPAQAHDEQGRVTVQERALTPGLPNIIAINSICDFEGQIEWVAGVQSPEEFRVSELRDPARLVVDVRH